jgi:molybdopterin/thiamine biosynthesis adenylyltransferase
VTDLLFERPRIKEIYGVFVLDGRVRLGTGEGYAAEIDDPEGKYGQLVRLLDGSRSMAQLRTELRDTLSPAEIDDSLRELDTSGYLEDAAAQPPPELAQDELERYRANLNFFNTLCSSGQSKYDYQTSLKRLRVGLIGLGGIGSNVAMALAELGVGVVRAIDFDKVELSNLNRQVLYSTPEVGELKALVATRRLHAFNPTLDFSASAERISTADEATRFVETAEPHVVFCLADKPNGHIDQWVNRACVERGVTMIAGSIFAGIGNAYSVVPGQTACYNCRVVAELERAPELQEELSHIQDSGFNVSNGATGPSCMFHAYFLAYEMLRIVSHIAPPLTANRLFEINFLTFEQHFTDFPLRADCSVCGGTRSA